MYKTIQRCSALLLCAASAWASAATVQISVLDKEGKPVPDAVVVVQPATAGTPRVALPLQATINQEKMRFAPLVTLVSVGAKIRFVNNDPWEHHVRGSATGLAQFDSNAGGGFELRLGAKPEGKVAESAESTFNKAGAVLLGCHLHASMRGHIYVSDSPWAALTNAEGIASFEDLPNGLAQVRTWHSDQLLDLPPQRITVGATPVQTTMQLSVVPRRRRI